MSTTQDIRNLRRAVQQGTERGQLVLRASQRHGFRELGDDFWARLTDDQLREIADRPETQYEEFVRVMDDLTRSLTEAVAEVRQKLGRVFWRR
jgi:hypothetical protein